ncbi:MAG: carboxylate-amine ligase [Thermoleophilaceae bacterium]
MSASTNTWPRTDSWSRWRGLPPTEPWTIGVEEEAMLLEPERWTLAHEIEAVLASLSTELSEHVTPETHGSALELRTGVHRTVEGAVTEMRDLRCALAGQLEQLGLRAASAGTHPSAIWSDTVVSSGSRQQFVYGSMRELARREPTFALHVHVGVPDPNDGIRLANRMRAYVPLLLALSVNSPFWQDRDTGLASARTPLFQAFPRVGIPRRFRDYDDYVETIDLLVRCQSIPDHTYLWWDVRPQPRLGTIEVRIMDAQTTVGDTGAIAALIQSLARLEVSSGHVHSRTLDLPEVLDENRFLAARDGMQARLIDPELERRVPARELLEEVVEACRPHAAVLGCERDLERVAALAESTGADRQRRWAAGRNDLSPVVEALADAYTA